MESRFYGKLYQNFPDVHGCRNDLLLCSVRILQDPRLFEPGFLGVEQKEQQDFIQVIMEFIMLRWGNLSTKPGIGRFDTVLNRFENEAGGLKDWAK